MNPRKVYWRLREIVRHPISELYLPAVSKLARLRHLPPGIRNRLRLRTLGVNHLPPASLRYRVHGDNSLYGFLDTGRTCREDIASALEGVGRALPLCRRILDFGCGCGRTLIWFTGQQRLFDLHGTDIDAEAVAWCQRNFVFATFAVNGALPPLDYPDGAFDLVYAISVFTHIDEEQQQHWLVEFKRIIAKGGLLLLTIHGEHVWKTLPAPLIAELKQAGILFVSDARWKGIFPEWYQTTYHTMEYALAVFSRHFEILKYVPRGMGRHQDLVILRNRAE